MVRTTKIAPLSAIIISGPTAVGKSKLALRVAKKLNGEIISVDSAQVYKHFNIGTDKPSLIDRSEIAHHCIDILEPTEQCTAAIWLKHAHNALDQIYSKDKTPIFVGGTTLYISALINGLTQLPQRSSNLRAKLEQQSNNELHSQLTELDKQRANKLHVNDRVRIIRALEILLTKKIDDINSSDEKLMFPKLDNVLIFALERDRKVLYQRINQRVEHMLESGLLEEAKCLYENYGTAIPAFKCLGYQQCAAYFAQTLNEKCLLEKISQTSRNYAKRQITFWNNEPRKKSWIENSRLRENQVLNFIDDLHARITNVSLPNLVRVEGDLS